MTTPLILYVPGLLPKPEPSIHREALRRCLVEGLRRHDEAVADDVSKAERSFDVVAWTYDFYGEHRDFSIDTAAIDELLSRDAASADEIRESTSWPRRTLRWLYRVGDFFPFLVPHLANERLELHLRDLRRYARNRNGIADHAREMLKVALRAAWKADRPILLVAHSMGSVIAFESLLQMSRDDRDDFTLGLFLTMGSPLGQRYLQRHLIGREERGAARYPSNIRRWINLAAAGDMTALDPHLANDFREMLDFGLVGSIEDIEVYNWFRLDGKLNEHAEYGYFVNDVTAAVVSDWWRRQRR